MQFSISFPARSEMGVVTFRRMRPACWFVVQPAPDFTRVVVLPPVAVPVSITE